MIHVIKVSHNLLDSINSPTDNHPSSTEMNGKFYFVDGDEVIFMSGKDTSKKFEVVSFKNNENKTYMEFY